MKIDEFANGTVLIDNKPAEQVNYRQMPTLNFEQKIMYKLFGYFKHGAYTYTYDGNKRWFRIYE